MYNYEWDSETGGYVLTTRMSVITRQVRPVFFEELELLGFNKYWSYPKTDRPLLWAQTRRYIHKGRLVAEASGGGLYTSPDVKIHEKDLEIQPVDVSAMTAKNKPMSDGIVQGTLGTIYRIFKEYKKKKIDVFYVAFSGGKDSLVLLDLVQRALPHNEFKVVFSDTTMEISDTYEAVELAKKRWSTLEFHTSRSHLDARESWELFGPPSRTQRWCCGVHKSAPAILLLRELTGKADLKALVFDGVRAEESDSRSAYSLVSDGDKHVTQINCHPLLDWNTAELFLYMFENDLFLNKAYNYGINRVGCLICPTASRWKEQIVGMVYEKQALPFVDNIHNNLIGKINNREEREKYISNGGWKNRIDGRDIITRGNHVIEQDNGTIFTITIVDPSGDWREWIKPLGSLVKYDKDVYMVIYKNRSYFLTIVEDESSIAVSIRKDTNTKDSIRFLYLLKNVFYKAAYCRACRACEVECPSSAILFKENSISINRKCQHCEHCLDKTRGCLIAKSKMFITGGNNVKIKGLGNYRGFGFRKEWLQYFIEKGDRLWKTDTLGRPQYDALKVWLRESEVTSGNSLTSFGKEISRFETNDIRLWAIIFNNLAYNSAIIRWYIQNIDMNTNYEIVSILALIGDKYSISTRENAVSSLKETFKASPIGIELGVGVYELKGKVVTAVTRTGWREPDPLVILYSLYKFAEVSDGYYSFTLTELINDNSERAGISPAQIFGIERDILKQLIQGLAIDYPDYIGVAFNKDLDNIDLRKGTKTSLDVLKLL
ncbi:MAG: phosphoadenosine phosphosulfate reductase family protein [Nitrospirae bacterium]|nr:phosphoadenosine phosphosulfate reductase family protein [Nitrospirota bacterium]